MILDFDLQAAVKIYKNFGSPNDSRQYLKGMLFDIGKDTITMVATDGHKLGKYVTEHKSEVIVTPSKIVIDIKPLMKIAPLFSKVEHQAVIEFDDRAIENPTVMFKIFASNDYSGMELKLPTIDTTYPDYNRVIPKKHYEEFKKAPCVNGDDLKKFTAFCTHRNTALKLYSTNESTGPIIVRTNDERFTGVIMPMRGF